MSTTVLNRRPEPGASREPGDTAGDTTFDGVLAFGGVDWWYHNRGHYDLQLLRRMARHVPVVYVNSLGMRVPRAAEGSMFARRVVRKAASLARGAVEVEPGFTVVSPPALPGRAGECWNVRLLPRFLKRVLRRNGIRRPLIWTACPAALPVVEMLSPVGTVLQRTDRFEAFHGVDGGWIAGLIARAEERSNLTLFCNRSLHDQEASRCRHAAFVDHGVDEERFVAAGEARREPADLASIPHPRVGFVGGVDAHTFDAELFRAVAKRVPEANFVLVGGRSLPEEAVAGANVVLLGRKPYAEVAEYMAACDVLIMPWNRNEWIAGCNPVKLKEYLAVGRPVVSTPFPELEAWRDVVTVADDAEAFAGALRAALTAPHDPARGRRRVAGHTWESRLDQVLDSLHAVGLRPGARSPRR